MNCGAPFSPRGGRRSTPGPGGRSPRARRRAAAGGAVRIGSVASGTRPVLTCDRSRPRPATIRRSGARPDVRVISAPNIVGSPTAAGRLGEADDPVEAVVIGDGQRLEAQPGGLGGQLLGVRRAVEEREVGVAVQLGVGHRAGPPSAVDVIRGLERLAPPAPRRTVAAGVPRRAPGRPPIAPGLPDSAASSSLPGPRRVVEPHRAQYRTIVRRTQVRKRSRGPAASRGPARTWRAGRRRASANVPSRRGPISPAPR